MTLLFVILLVSMLAGAAKNPNLDNEPNYN
jgi:hypothetical protein